MYVCMYVRVYIYIYIYIYICIMLYTAGPGGSRRGSQEAICGRFSNEDPARSGLESKRVLSVEGVFS